LNVWQWAEKNMILTTADGAIPGRYRVNVTPYMREILERLSVDDPVETVALMFAAQMGKTTGGNAWMGYVIDYAPGPILAVQPTLNDAERESKGRVSNLIFNCPSLRKKVGDPRLRDSDNTIKEKRFPGGVLHFTGANVATGFRGKPIRYLFTDEVDAYPIDVGGEGDPISLAKKRTRTYSTSRKHLITSTPTVKGASRIEKTMENSDWREYWVPCPRCEKMQVLRWRDKDTGEYRIKWPGNEPEKAYYECEYCGGRIENHEKEYMLPRGEWRASRVGDGQTAGYHLSALYAPHGWDTWGVIAAEFVEVKNDPVRLKTWINTVLAETWDEDDGEKLDMGDLEERVERFAPKLPEDAYLVTAGVDVQDNRLEMEVVAWTDKYESWSIDYRIFWGDPTDLSDTGPWSVLDEYLKTTTFPHAIFDLPIHACCIDSGYQSQTVYRFCYKKEKRRVWPIKGGADTPQGERPIFDLSKFSKPFKGRIKLRLVGVTAAKNDCFARLQVTEHGPGFCHFPRNQPWIGDREGDVPGYFRQLTAESKQTRYSKTGHKATLWVAPQGAPVEAWDCRVYAYAAMVGLAGQGYKLKQNRQPREAKRRKQMQTPPRHAGQQPARRRRPVFQRTR